MYIFLRFIFSVYSTEVNLKLGGVCGLVFGLLFFWLGGFFSPIHQLLLQDLKLLKYFFSWQIFIVHWQSGSTVHNVKEFI